MLGSCELNLFLWPQDLSNQVFVDLEAALVLLEFWVCQCAVCLAWFFRVCSRSMAVWIWCSRPRLNWTPYLRYCEFSSKCYWKVLLSAVNWNYQQGKSLNVKRYLHIATSWGLLKPGPLYGNVTQTGSDNKAEKTAEEPLRLCHLYLRNFGWLTS